MAARPAIGSAPYVWSNHAMYQHIIAQQRASYNRLKGRAMDFVPFCRRCNKEEAALS
jgi:hypothetical protein